jgi:hypothetical protein
METAFIRKLTNLNRVNRSKPTNQRVCATDSETAGQNVSPATPGIASKKGCQSFGLLTVFPVADLLGSVLSRDEWDVEVAVVAAFPANFMQHYVQTLLTCSYLPHIALSH